MTAYGTCSRCGGPLSPDGSCDNVTLVAGGPPVATMAARIRALPFAPGTTTGARQAWMRECAARLVEGRIDMPPWPPEAAHRTSPDLEAGDE